MRRIAAAILTLLAGPAFSTADAPPDMPGVEIVPLSFGSLAGWRVDDHAAALRAFLKTCSRPAGDDPRAGLASPPGLAEACREAVRIGSEAGSRGSALPEGQGEGRGLSGEGATLTPSLSLTGEGATSRVPRRVGEAGGDGARQFFERRFAPFEVRPPGGRGFLTGYYEPELPGSPVPTPEFSAPLLAFPDGPSPYPDRAAIEDGALRDRARPLVWLSDVVAVFVVQVQGSARIRLPDGQALRVAYAGRNGHPYTSVARLLVARLGVPPAAMTAGRLTDWLRANPAEARDLLRQNRSYVFFRRADELAPGDGPVGAAGIPLGAGRSLAVDATVWPYGMPVWIEGGFSDPPAGRLVIAQDTGAAITGAARGDLFVGSGDEAGLRAGPIRAGIRFVVLWPKPGQAP